MRQWFPASLLVLIVLGVSVPAQAADPKAIFGAWIENLPGGGGVITEFTATTITSYSVNAAGQRISTPITASVTYRDLGKTIGVDFQGGGGALVAINGPAAITLDFPDAAAHALVPWKPKIGPTLKP